MRSKVACELRTRSQVAGDFGFSKTNFKGFKDLFNMLLWINNCNECNGITGEMNIYIYDILDAMNRLAPYKVHIGHYGSTTKYTVNRIKPNKVHSEQDDNRPITR